MRQSRNGKQAKPDGGDAAIYCRISQAGDEDQTGVDRQERICRETADRLGVHVADVFVDNNRSAWRRNRERPGWDELLENMATGKYRHVLVYHPDRLMRQPKDLEQLLAVADDQHITLHGQANRRDLSDPDDRFILRIEVAHACRSSDDTSRRIVSALEEKARAGDPHMSKRPYGYTPDRRAIVEEEAEVIRDIFRRYLDGESPEALARDLHERGITTAQGKTWQGTNIRNLLSQPFLAGIQVYRGEQIGTGNWPAIIDLGQWQEVQEVRSYRAAQHTEGKRPQRYYLLRGVATCTCGQRMAGSKTKAKANYRCTRMAFNGEGKCQRVIAADPLEAAVKDVALEVLEKLDVTGHKPATTSRPETDVKADEDDARQLQELNQMWLAKEVPTPEYRTMRRAIEDRIKERQRRTVQRPVAVLQGIAGPDARKAWAELENERNYARMNAIYRFLFSAVIIHPAKKMGRGLDLGRIEIEPAPLWD
ncbi:recombinase family protein [Streptomyces sediminimaris]|uniref:recombinase family protein n=1 Tax=Streptomyces sediminimaris TaxID=3383721 RepID=UPI00399A6CBF